MSCFNIAGDMALNEDETDAEFVDGAASTLQEIKVGAQIFEGSYRFDKTKGLPYLDDVFVKNPDLRLIRIIFYAFLSGITGVTEVETINLRVDAQARILYVQFKVHSDSGVLEDTIALQFP